MSRTTRTVTRMVEQVVQENVLGCDVCDATIVTEGFVQPSSWAVVELSIEGTPRYIDLCPACVLSYRLNTLVEV